MIVDGVIQISESPRWVVLQMYKGCLVVLPRQEFSRGLRRGKWWKRAAAMRSRQPDVAAAADRRRWARGGDEMTVVTHMGQPVVLCDACYDAIGGSAVVVYPQPNGRSHFPGVRAYCNDSCRARGERGQVGPTVTGHLGSVPSGLAQGGLTGWT